MLKQVKGASLAVQWLGLCASIAGGKGLVPDRGTKILHAAQRSPKIKEWVVFLILAILTCLHCVSLTSRFNGM